MIPAALIDAAVDAMVEDWTSGRTFPDKRAMCEHYAKVMLPAAFAALPDCDEARAAARDRIPWVTGFEAGTPSYGAASLGATVAFAALAVMADPATAEAECFVCERRRPANEMHRYQRIGGKPDVYECPDHVTADRLAAFTRLQAES